MPANGAPLLISPTNNGIVEQEQNGVTEPSNAPKALFNNFDFVVRAFWILSFEM